jgi:thiol-disulfide isomerase/thioredoxin
MLRYLLTLLLSIVLGQTISAQVVFTIQQKGYKQDSVPELLIGNYMEVVPTKTNDSTYQYLFNPERPEYLFIVIDKKNRWVTRLWITPEMKQTGLKVDYTKHTVTPEKINEWDLITQKVFDFQDTKQQPKADSVVEFYVQKDFDSYFSLWLLRFFGNKPKQLALMDKLSPRVKEYPEYGQLKASLTTRKYPNIGDTFTEFALTDINDAVLDTRNIKNKWILLNFWSNGCGPCVRELDDFVKLYKSIDTSKIEFISIALDEDKNKWKKATATNKIIWPSVWTADNVYCFLCLNYNVYSMPFFILFDNKKKLVFIKDGSDELENIRKELSAIK